MNKCVKCGREARKEVTIRWQGENRKVCFCNDCYEYYIWEFRYESKTKKRHCNSVR